MWRSGCEVKMDGRSKAVRMVVVNAVVASRLSGRAGVVVRPFWRSRSHAHVPALFAAAKSSIHHDRRHIRPRVPRSRTGIRHQHQMLTALAPAVAGACQTVLFSGRGCTLQQTGTTSSVPALRRSRCSALIIRGASRNRKSRGRSHPRPAGGAAPRPPSLRLRHRLD